jgi:hypothetical protein
MNNIPFDCPVQYAEDICKGKQIAEILQLKPIKGYNPPRYNTTHGTKTALGLYRTLKHIIN